MTSETTYVYDFADGSLDMKPLLGGKGANLSEMTRIGIPVPDGFTVTTAACVAAMKSGGEWPVDLWPQVEAHLDALEARTGRTLGASDKPLLVSVRSGSVFSMPGMMDTILNLGISDESAGALAKETGNERFAWDSYRRFVQMYAEVVEGAPPHIFEDELTAMKAARGVDYDTDLSADDLKELVATFRRVAKEATGTDLPTDPREQLKRSIGAVFASWDNPRANIYRNLNKIPHDLGTAVNVQQMVFGNRGDTSASGVAFTRNPATGVKELYGEYLVNAQGEDVVAGIRTGHQLPDMEKDLPKAFAEFTATMDKLEAHYGDMQDIEFTVEDNTLYILQTRAGKRTAAAALKVARDMVEAGTITKEDALRRIEPAQLDQLLHPGIDPSHGETPITKGLNASPGAAVGRVVFDADTAAECGEKGEKVVLVRWETTPDDIHGVVAAQGVLTSHGGMTSHAAVVARGMGKPCVAGCGDLRIDTAAKTATIGDRVLTETDVITLDGSTGEIYDGALKLTEAQITDDFREVLGWADEIRRLGVRANADTGPDAAKARELGAEGIGLTRTEHMFMAPDRLPVVQEMILAQDEAGRGVALDKLLPMQQADFEELFEAMTGLPVTIRLIDPPLHEFLPNLVEQSLVVQRLEDAGTTGAELDDARELLGHVRRLSEANPMLGTRGCRLLMLYPEIAVMQVRAIARAAAAVTKRGFEPHVEIMIPLVAYWQELDTLRQVAEKTWAEEAPEGIDRTIGTMIELPRAAVTADQIAQYADFFSFGTNDLTQTGVGISRDDAEGSFLQSYIDMGVVPTNPFASIDPDGVAELVRIGVEKGRGAKPGLKTGVCGEHGGDPDSITIFNKIGLDYVSCSPYRIPIARLAAARAVLGDTVKDA
ncbi:MAG: pyruvate, phosphate dikinase [Cellulomonadaceae bacterium]|jgi:pyruvate,orthophosphate dikinase|nr:pyruvate, phosphate dikinase [Cellulomonadaceae bacterium]